MESLNIKYGDCYTGTGLTMEYFMQDNQRQTDWAYIAGVMDSDGCFMITKHKRQWKGHSISPCYLPSVKISQAEPETIDYITNILGLGFYKLDRARIRQYEDGKRFGRKPMYDWFIRNKKILIPFLENVMLYLRIKKKRAQHLLNYCMNVESKFKNKLSQNELDYREDMYVKMREFNGNKVAATTKSCRFERISDSLNS